MSALPTRGDAERRERLIRQALERHAHQSEWYQREGRCTLAEAVVVLMRLEREGLVERGNSTGGMTWRAAR